MRPFPNPSLQRLRAVYDSIHGRIVSAWAYEESTFTWQIELPPNTTATIYVPAAPGALINDQELQALREEGITFLALAQAHWPEFLFLKRRIVTYYNV
ncbi:alpha-L-rhamnosidase C-terminal domain-containing protein [Ktedonobacter racemifer]|uniref:alpha-L-rhamnosidase C-terminal domain-containing protein n=1 Tax=Ktedonobacter racemifer TaxID=363277 RepID=UPI0002DB5F50|nr:alpha-L-rhamnosidase C-terminal domain-containing protein [Ktedonobacter racemifer]